MYCILLSHWSCSDSNSSDSSSKSTWKGSIIVRYRLCQVLFDSFYFISYHFVTSRITLFHLISLYFISNHFFSFFCNFVVFNSFLCLSMSNLLNKSDSLITSCTTSSCCTSHYFPLSLFDALLFYYLTYYINTIFSGKFRYVYHTFMSFSHSLNFFIFIVM